MFTPFNKIPRLNRDIVVTEKIDGTNAQIFIDDATIISDEDQPFIIDVIDGLAILAGSRNKWIVPGSDNFGFAGWVKENAKELISLGTGQHFGEWWGKGIQRGYGLDTKKFSLFNTGRWKTVASDAPGLDPAPACCSVVPVLYSGAFDQRAIQVTVDTLITHGSQAAPGFMDPEGIIVYHTAANQMFKVTCKDDNKPKTWQEKNGVR
jgi:hypothetical protein